MLFDLPLDGRIEVKNPGKFFFPDGIPGVCGESHFTIIPSIKAKPFQWLVNINDPRIFLVVLEPEIILANYQNEILEDPIAKENLNSNGKMKTYCIVNFTSPDNPTINLRSPVILDLTNKIGIQIILNGEKYGIREHLWNLTKYMGG
jgi:flagellar assembly factor FliW